MSEAARVLLVASLSQSPSALAPIGKYSCLSDGLEPPDRRDPQVMGTPPVSADAGAERLKPPEAGGVCHPTLMSSVRDCGRLTARPTPRLA